MAKSISEEALQLRKRARRRLIGAITLVAMVAVFLPMVLEHEPKPVSQDISIRIPAPNSNAFTSKIVPVPTAPQQAAGDMAAQTVSAGKPQPGTQARPPAYDTEAAPANEVQREPPRAPVTTPPPKSAASPAAKSAPAAKLEPPKSASRYMVQVAALNDADKAQQMQKQIAAAGVRAYTEVVPTQKGNVTRVRAGPFASRDEAEKMQEKLKKMGLSGNIVPG